MDPAEREDYPHALVSQGLPPVLPEMRPPSLVPELWSVKEQLQAMILQPEEILSCLDSSMVLGFISSLITASPLVLSVFQPLSRSPEFSVLFCPEIPVSPGLLFPGPTNPLLPVSSGPEFPAAATSEPSALSVFSVPESSRCSVPLSGDGFLGGRLLPMPASPKPIRGRRGRMIKSAAPAAASLELAASAEPPVPAVVQPPVSGSSLPDSSGSAVFKFPAAGPSVPEPPVLVAAASAAPKSLVPTSSVAESSSPVVSSPAVAEFLAAGPSVPEPPVLELAASAVPYPSVSMTPAPASSVPAFAVEEITAVVPAVPAASASLVPESPVAPVPSVQASAVPDAPVLVYG